MVAPAYRVEEVLDMPIGLALDLLAARARLNERIRRRAERSAGTSRSDGGIERRPDGTMVMRITSFEQLASVLPRMR